MATPVEHILRNARAKPLTNEEVNVGSERRCEEMDASLMLLQHVILPISQFLFNRSKENDLNEPDWFADRYTGSGTLTESTAFLIRG